MIRSVEPFGDTAVLVGLDDLAAAHRLGAYIEAGRDAGGGPAGVVEAVVGFGNLVIHLDPHRTHVEEIVSWLSTLALDGPSPPVEDRSARGPRLVVVATTFDGPDLTGVAGALGTTRRSVIASLCGSDLEVAFVGFAPGFPYLTGLPAELAAVTRRLTPRPSVPAGSVAVAGGFASVYPQETPGGWMLIGRTSLPLFDRTRPPYALLRPGDTVRFAEVSDAPSGPTPEGPTPPGRRPLLVSRGRRSVEVVEPGLLSLVEDAGRHSVAALGVPRAGPADPEALRLANRLVGNPDGSAAIEMTALGPTLRFDADAHVTVVGAATDAVDVSVEGHQVGSGSVVPVRAGQVVAVGRVRSGLRAYLAVAGGFDSPLEVGSRSTDVLCGLGPPPLRPGDRLDIGPPGRPRGQLSSGPRTDQLGSPRSVRVLAGPHRLDPASYARLGAATWMVGEASNRIGIRLVPESGSGVDLEGTAPAIPSTGMVTGAVQVPPDGNPIVLMPDHATVGGYPVACCVISADLPVLGQLGPGDTIRLTTVEPDEARRAWERAERALDQRVSGWFPTAAAT